jgi:hypothetical protein
MPRFDTSRLNPELKTNIEDTFTKLNAMKDALRSDRERGGLAVVELEFERALREATSNASADYRIAASMPRIVNAADLLMEIFRGADETKVNNAEEIRVMLVDVIAPELHRHILSEFE